MVFQKPTLELICSYLKNRQQSVQVNDLSSSKNRANPGGQGTIQNLFNFDKQTCMDTPKLFKKESTEKETKKHY